MSQALGLEELEARLRGAWSAKTSTKWTARNPALGQCSVTALAVQRLCGGEILKTQTPDGPHFYNRIDGVAHDFTASQFDRPLSYAHLPSDEQEALADTSQAQLEALLANLGARP
ncbi:MAG TPA: hypothetical protein VN231_00620 [Allosphingosinicella sp.]|nr:hypothetical protein [Allosphingosinicella sp.]